MSLWIQADQLAGQWYARAGSLEPIADEKQIHTAFETIYKFNVSKVKDGRIGAINGIRPDGDSNNTTLQAREIWPGVTFSIAAAMIQEGMVETGFKTAQGACETIWSKDGFGFAFQSPGAWIKTGEYRSIQYMRPLAIWAIQWALSPTKLHTDIELDETTTDGSLNEENFDKVAKFLRLPKENKSKSILRVIYDIVRPSS